MSCYSDDESNSMLKRIKTNVPLVLSFSDADKQGTIQPHDDALVVTLRIVGYNVKRVIVDQGSVAEIMYPVLYKGLGLKPEDLTTYSSPLVSFEGKMVVPKGQIRLPVQAGGGCGRSRFYRDRCICPVYDHYRQALAAFLGCCFIHPSSEGEVPFWRSSVGDSGKPVYG